MSHEKLTVGGLVFRKCNLCDPAQEPSDQELGQLMECVAQEAIRRNEEAARVLNDEIDREIAKIPGRLS